jgi:hypothetical protein
MARQIDSPIQTVKPFQKGDALTAEKLNQTANQLNRTNAGVAPPSQVLKTYPKSSDSLPTSCRTFVDDSATQPLAGLYEIDGITPDEEDLILVAFDTALDGVYRAKVGNWVRVGKLASSTTDKAPVYKKGSIISIYDGDSFPLAYVVGVENLSEV